MKHSPFAVLLRCILASALLLLTVNGHATTEKLLHSFVQLPDGYRPTAPLIEDEAGNLYGTVSEGGLHGRGVVYELSSNSTGGWTQQVLYSFSGAPDGSNPQGRLVMDSAGNLYGTTQGGGNAQCNCGTVYELSRTSTGAWQETILYRFLPNFGDAAGPMAGLTFDQAGNLYGTTVSGGAYGGYGAVFELSPSGGRWSEQVIYSFPDDGPGGMWPESEVLVDAAGDLYSTTSTGGALGCGTSNGYPYGCGTVFKLTKANRGWSETVIYAFSGSENWIGPSGRLLMDAAGNLFGPAAKSIYELQPTSQGAWTYSAIRGGISHISGDLTMDAAGNFYGEGSYSCNNTACGSVFKLQKNAAGNWMLKTLYTFQSSNDAYDPCCGVTLDRHGNIFGVTPYFGDQHHVGSVFELTPTSTGPWKETILFEFPQVDGAGPAGDLISDANGNLYGVASYGGQNTNCYFETLCGVIFEASPNGSGQWSYNILYDFSQNPGGSPRAGLTLDAAGDLYGTTWGGGLGNGTVFELSPGSGGVWTLKTLYTFGSLPHDGSDPFTGVVFDSNGNLFGTTATGGWYGCGTVYELSPQADGSWKETILHSFSGMSDGWAPIAGLVLDSAGNIYGTVEEGGSRNCNGFGCGVVFKLSPTNSGNWTFRSLYIFSGADGEEPDSPLVFDKNGNLYGTTARGGTTGYGVAFQLSPSGTGTWSETVLHSFPDTATDGIQPNGVKVDAAGNLWGTTFYGGPGKQCYGGGGCGTIFELTPSSAGWTQTIIHSFGVVNDGIEPVSNVVLGGTGKVYGSTFGGPGDNWGGTVFEIIP